MGSLPSLITENVKLVDSPSFLNKREVWAQTGLQLPGVSLPCKGLISYSSFFDAIRSEFDAVAKLCGGCGWWHLRETEGKEFIKC